MYCLRPGTSYLWAVTPSGVKFFKLPGQELILPLIDRHTRAVLSAKDVLAQADAPGVRPLSRSSGAREQPHSAPWQGIRHRRPGDVWSQLRDAACLDRASALLDYEDVTIVNARSLSLLAGSQAVSQVPTDSKRLLLIGDPVYNHPEFQSLPHAREEVVEVAEHFSPTRRLLLTGVNATPTAYEQSAPSNFAYIHFVSHGVGSTADPLDSAIILSPDPGAAASYRLYARQILEQRLHAELVTISVSLLWIRHRVLLREGLVGLDSWAFLRAGSHSVIGALWEVNDTSTPRLMSDLYGGLADGRDPATALRAAKLSMIHGDGAFRKPFYWASFQLYSGK